MKVGDVVWFIENGYKCKVIIKRLTKSDALIKFTDRDGGIRISVNRLFETEDDADQYLNNKKKENDKFKERHGYKKTPYDYM